MIVCYCSSSDCQAYGCARTRTTGPKVEVVWKSSPAWHRGWTCPSCGVNYAPSVPSCPCSKES